MTSTTPENFFDNTGGGVGAPSARLSAIDDFVYGEIVDQSVVDKKKFGKDEVETDSRTGEPLKQLVIILQTENRNWASVAKVPKNEDGSEKAPSEDDGRRAIYVPKFTNIHAAIGDAVIEATGQKGPVLNGGTLGVKVVELKDTGKGNPLKIHQAKYLAPQPKSEADGFFGGGDAAPAQSQAAPAAQPQQSQPAAQAAPAAEPAPTVSNPAPTDPWTGQPAGSTGEKPPF